MNNIYITGFMGSGKSTFGAELANILGYSFTDLDKSIEEKAGKGISEIFEKDGEDAFRQMETDTLKETAKLEKHVIATGGGTPCFSDNMEWMNEHGKTVYIKLFDSELFTRLSEDETERPLLKDMSEAELRNFIYKTLRQRAYFYHQSQIVIDGLNMSAAELAEKLK